MPVLKHLYTYKDLLIFSIQEFLKFKIESAFLISIKQRLV